MTGSLWPHWIGSCEISSCVVNLLVFTKAKLQYLPLTRRCISRNCNRCFVNYCPLAKLNTNTITDWSFYLFYRLVFYNYRAQTCGRLSNICNIHAVCKIRIVDHVQRKLLYWRDHFRVAAYEDKPLKVTLSETIAGGRLPKLIRPAQQKGSRPRSTMLRSPFTLI